MKTISLKKVTVVAVASLGFGLLSVVPANAAITQTATISGTTDGTTAVGVGVVYATGSTITATVNVATATTMSAAGDYINATVGVTGPSIADPTSTTATVTSTPVAVADTATLTSSVPATGTLRGTWVSGSSTSAQPIGKVTFSPTMPGRYTITVTPLHAKIAGTVDTGATLTAATLIVTVGSDSVLAATVGTSITELNKAVGQSGGQTAYRFSPAGFTKSADAVTTYFATVDTGSITSVTNGANAGGTGGVQAMTSALTNSVNNADGYKLTSTISNAGAWNAGGTQGVAVGLWTITLQSGTATTQTLTIKQLNATTGAITTVATATSTYGAAPAISSLSTSILNAGAGTGAATDTTSSAVSATATGQQFNIVVTTKDQYNVALGAQTVSATISGSGLIAAAAGTAGGTGNARAASAKSDGSGNVAIGVNADGTSGKGVITISVGTTVIATETVTFYGAVKTLTAKQNHTIASTAGAALGDGSATPGATTIGTTPAVVITAKDANGNAVPGLTITAVSSDTTVMSQTITVNGDSVTTGDYNVQVNSVANTSGKTATLTFRVMSGTTVLAATPALTYTLGGAVSTVALSLDKTTYSQGSAAVATLTLKDASGNPVFDGDHANILTAALSTTMSVVKTLAFSTTATSAASLGGTSKVSFNAPASATAEWKISGTTGAGPAVDSAKALSATASVTDASASLLTQIDALNAKIVALNALIAKIMKKLGVK